MLSVIPFPAAAPVPDDVVALRDAVAGLRRRHRRLVTAAGRWALAHGVPLPADHIALWAAAVERTLEFPGAGPGEVGGVIGPWPHDQAAGDWAAAAAEWCEAAGCRPPADLAESLRHLSDFLSEAGHLGGGETVAAVWRLATGGGGFGAGGPAGPPPGPRAA